MALELRSSLLHLRPLCPQDAAPIAAYRGLREVAKYQSWESFNHEDAVRLIQEQALVIPNTPSTWLQLAISLSPTKELIGDCGIHFCADSQQVELGITLSPIHQGYGLATGALQLVLEYVFDTLGKRRASATTDAENAPAGRLFERNGFRRESHRIDGVWFKDAGGSEYTFSLLRREWEEQRQ